MRPLMKGMIALAGGALLTVFTGLVDVTPPDLMGARWFGFPTPWLYRMIVAPEYFPWRADPLGLIADVAAWTATVGIAVLLFWRTSKAPEDKPPRPV